MRRRGSGHTLSLFRVHSEDNRPLRVDTPVLTSAVWSEEKQSFADSNPQYQEREALFTRFCEGPVDLCCLGDSITQKFE